MNIRGKTISDITRDPESEALRLHFTDGSGATFEIDGFRLIRMVPEYPTIKPGDKVTGHPDGDLFILGCSAPDKLLEDFMQPSAPPLPACPLRYVKSGRFGWNHLQWHNCTEWVDVPVVEVDE